MSHHKSLHVCRTINPLSGRSRALIVALVLLASLGWLTTTVLHGQGAVDALYIDKEGRVGIGTPSPQATLDVAGTTSLGGPVTLAGKGDTDGYVSLQLRSGNSADSRTNPSSQITLGYKGTDSYRHVIKTRHHSEQVTGNAIDFYVWKFDPNDRNASRIGGLHTMTLDGGRVGIGTPDPTTTLDVRGATSLGADLSVTGATTIKDRLQVDKNAAITGELTVKGAVNAVTMGPWPHATGYVMYGASSLNHAQMENYALLQNVSNGDTFVNSPTAVALRTKNVDRMVIRDDGIDLPNGWKITTGATSLVFHSNGRPIMAVNSNERLQYEVPGLGFYFLGKNDWGTKWYATWDSDRRLKSDIEPITSALDKVGRLRGVVYRWSEAARERFLRDMSPTAPAGSPGDAQARAAEERARIAEQLARPQIGVIAQEVEAVVPELVGTNADGYKVVQYGQLAALLVEAVKEQRTEIEALKAANAHLRAQVDELPALRAAAGSASAEIADIRAQLAQLGAAVQRVSAVPRTESRLRGESTSPR